MLVQYQTYINIVTTIILNLFIQFRKTPDKLFLQSIIMVLPLLWNYGGLAKPHRDDEKKKYSNGNNNNRNFLSHG